MTHLSTTLAERAGRNDPPKDTRCVDFKKHFALGDKTRCYPLTERARPARKAGHSSHSFNTSKVARQLLTKLNQVV